MSQHTRLLEAAKEAADELHRDTSVSMHQTLEDLRDLREHVTELMEAVESTMPDEESDDDRPTE